MYKNSAASNYTTTSVSTADQGRLILICYDVAIKSCTMAKEFVQQKKHVERSKSLYKAQDAVTELMVALNMNKGGVIAKRLYSLYDYFNWRLSEANIKQDTRMIDEVLLHLKSLREAWVIAIDKVKKEKFDQAAPVQTLSFGLVG
ncbi:MAG: flagellar export chaperone FliS [Elusimicrobia bacterium RIFOXYB2_FULL_49_7]|nr:MAG: flagellar export chaperone FliS [Elusimicrobia bacterium RIFOXYB2_FULL_49_7]